MSKVRKPYKKIAMTLSICLMILWATLGTGASLAWFADTTPELKNIFQFAEFDLVVSQKQPDGTYEAIDANTPIFIDEALYEPGYVQIVYLKVENVGTVPFDYKTAVIVTDYTTATNVYGTTFNLQPYLRFGVVSASTEAELLAQLATREMAVAKADLPLNNYTTEEASLNDKDSGANVAYLALIVRMPESVGNEANYRGEDIPRVELGVTITATQQAQ